MGNERNVHKTIKKSARSGKVVILCTSPFSPHSFLGEIHPACPEGNPMISRVPDGAGYSTRIVKGSH